jgi:AcrR family transcriptional regulator
MATNPKKRQDRREAILAAAFDAFVENGFAGTTMLDIARRAGASKETLYAWFASKEKLYETLLKSRMQAVGANLAAEAGPDFDPQRVLYVIARDLLRFANERGVMALLTDAPRSPELRRFLATSIDRTHLAGYFERWKSSGAMDFDNAEETASMFIVMAHGEWPLRIRYGIIDSMTEEEIERHARLATAMFLRAVGSGPRQDGR